MIPAIVMLEMEEELLLSVSGSETDTTTVYTDDPQEPGDALSRLLNY